MTKHTEVGHTPAPYTLDELKIIGKDGNMIADCFYNSEDYWMELQKHNAKFILTACNNHYSMLNALEAALDMYNLMPMEMRDMNIFKFRKIVAAIDKAQGGS